ncbi:hypothetical protein H6796_00115 [Candidatus Nomurabacteria bacterium]|nr:hypothetical protein [Candidatus Nomurabacteria bacterium]
MSIDILDNTQDHETKAYLDHLSAKVAQESGIRAVAAMHDPADMLLSENSENRDGVLVIPGDN